jgi:adenylate cyclase
MCGLGYITNLLTDSRSQTIIKENCIQVFTKSFHVFSKRFFINSVLNVCLILVGSGVLVYIYNNNLFQPLDTKIQDLTVLSQQPSSKVIILGIDQRALDRLGGWPWDRKYLAQSINKLNEQEVESIVLDLPLYDPRPNDDSLVKSINQSRAKIILKAYINQQNELVGPSFKPSLNAEQSWLGVSGLILENQQTSGYFQPIATHNQGCSPNLGVQATLLHTQQSKPSCEADSFQVAGTSITTKPTKIVLYGPAQHIATYSILDLLEDKLNPEDLKNKIVFIGPTQIVSNQNTQNLAPGTSFDLISKDFTNTLQTPFGPLPEVEIQASIASSVLQNKLLTKPPIWVEQLVIVLLFAGLYLVGRYTWSSISFSLGLYILSGYVLLPVWFNSKSIQLNLLYPSLGLILGWMGGFGVRWLNDYRYRFWIKHGLKKYVTRSYLQKLEFLNQPTDYFEPIKKYSTILSLRLYQLDQIMDTKSSSETLKILKQIFWQIRQTCQEWDGFLTDSRPDHYCVVWNTYLEDPQHPFKACLSAVQIQTRLQNFAQQNNLHIQFGIGICTGEILFGNLSQTGDLDFQAFGPKVTLADQLSQMSQKLQSDITSWTGCNSKILISQNTYNWLRRSGQLDDFKITEITDLAEDLQLLKYKTFVLADQVEQQSKQPTQLSPQDQMRYSSKTALPLSKS